MGKIKKAIKKIVFKVIKPPIISVNNSNSQAGEDRIIQYLFSSMGISSFSYIDIGANDPIGCNNTYLFYNWGCRGVLVEPDLNFSERIKSARPNDIVVNAAISNEGNKNADFFVFNEPSLNTLSKEDAEMRVKSGMYKLTETRSIRLITIEDIIHENLNGTVPHLISLDIEGVDYQVLKAFDFEKYPVPVWIVETCEYSENHIKPKVTSIIDLMLSKGYFVFADTYINTIFVDKKWFNNYNAT
ncbi:FkbM family methyltransferase [Mucilaginibacter sp.]|jgi:FkbM family methyltransferase|uniref:FkbM family methyltransferase n=1 Tax=Mucilaginibacter sp. TaxID=1882438 RepID=UPI00356B050E